MNKKRLRVFQAIKIENILDLHKKSGDTYNAAIGFIVYIRLKTELNFETYVTR